MISRFAKAFFAIIFALVVLTTVLFIRPHPQKYLDPWTGKFFGEGGVEVLAHSKPPAAAGGVIMGTLGNATAKAELGRATWKLLHTMTLRYPEEPTQDERDALSSYLHLTSRLYPCGECAAEFQELLKRYPPQTSSRRAASIWLCAMHNKVNERLKKPEFDCSDLEKTYDCGCGDPPDTLASPAGRDGDSGEDEDTGIRLIKGGR